MIIFDLDGVIVDSRELHFAALNKALEHYNKNWIITKEEHATTYDGLPTKEKLKLLSSEKGLDVSLHSDINNLKQHITQEMMESYKPDQKLIDIFKWLSDIKQTICVASNSIRKTIDLVLSKKQIDTYVSYIVSNEDVVYPKPNPQMYLKCMEHFGESPKNTYIVEDSYYGRLAAYESAANVIQVKNSTYVTKELIESKINVRNDKMKWENKNLNVLIPMAGDGSRFKNAGFDKPKPMIDVNGIPMIARVIENLNIDANYIFLVRKEHEEKHQIVKFLSKITPNCKVVLVDSLTEGAACTTLLAKDLIDNDQELMIANSDQLVDFESGEFYHSMNNENIDGGVLTFNSDSTKWSYAAIDSNNVITRIAEKEVISNHATVGIYYWKRGSDYVKYAENMILKNIRYGMAFNGRGEYYVAPVYNEAILDNKIFRVYDVKHMYGLGTPEDLKVYLNTIGKQHD